MGLGVWVFGGRDTAHRHPAPYSRSLLGRDRPHPHHNGTDSTWFKGIEGVSMCGVFDFLDSHLVTFWGGKNKYIDQSMRIFLLGLPIITYRMLGGAELYAAY